MLRSRFLGIAFSGLLFSNLALSYAPFGYTPNFNDQGAHAVQHMHQGRIVVTNHAGQPVEVRLHGNYCGIRDVLRQCQSAFLQDGEQFTFFLNGHNEKSSTVLWIEMKYPKAVYRDKSWYCYNNKTQMRVDGANEWLLNYGYTGLEIRKSWSDATQTVSCAIDTYPGAL